MERPSLHSTHTFLALTFALPIALACSSSGGDEGGGDAPKSPLGQQMSQIAALGDAFVGQNEKTYDGVAYAAQYVATAFGSGGAPAALTAKGGGAASCFPGELLGVTYELDFETRSYVPSSLQGAPGDATRFMLYEVVGGNASSTSVGSVDVKCTGLFPNVNVQVIVNSDGVEVLDLLASNAYFGPGSYGATLTGTLRNADGSEEIPIGASYYGGGFINMDEFSSGASLSFELQQGVFAYVDHSISVDMGFGGSSYATLSVFQERDFVRAFDFNSMLIGTDGPLTGPGIFRAEEPLGDGYNYFVNCFEGSIDQMLVTAADSSCLNEYYELDPTPIPGPDLDAIQEGADAVLGMYNAVIAVAEVGGAIGMSIAASQFEQF